MPTFLLAGLRHAVLYLQVMDDANDLYISGGDAVTSALDTFDQEQQNIQSAQKWLAELISRIRKKDLSEDALLTTAAQLLNVYPDSGSYLISVRLNAAQRINWLLSALQVSRWLSNDVTTQAHLGNLGLAFYELGEMERAEIYLRKAILLAARIGDRRHQAAWFGNLGNIYAAIGDHRKAIVYHRKQMSIAKAEQDNRIEANALGNLGVSYAFLGQRTYAKNMYMRQLSLTRKIGDLRGEGYALQNLGLTCQDIGELEDAGHFLHESLEVVGRLKDRFT